MTRLRWSAVLVIACLLSGCEKTSKTVPAAELGRIEKTNPAKWENDPDSYMPKYPSGNAFRKPFRFR